MWTFMGPGYGTNPFTGRSHLHATYINLKTEVSRICIRILLLDVVLETTRWRWPVTNCRSEIPCESRVSLRNKCHRPQQTVVTRIRCK